MDTNEQMGVGFGIMGLLYLALIILTIAGLWKVFVKAGKPGWAAIVPVYNFIVIAEIVGKPLWWGVMVLVPCVGIVFQVWLLNLLSKSFGKSEGFTVGMVLLPFIFLPMLGFGDARYQGPTAAEARGGDSLSQFKSRLDPSQKDEPGQQDGPGQ